MDLKGKTVVITGASAGIGRVTALELARGGARVLLACRSREKTASLIRDIAGVGGESDFVDLDLASLESVQRCAQTIRERVPRIDLLINNAGLAGSTGLTRDGFEIAFGVNHVGHFALTTALLDRLNGSRVITVASRAHFNASGLDFGSLRRSVAKTKVFTAYANAKLANILFGRELARRHPELRSYTLHPGVVKTEIWRKVPQPFRWFMTRNMLTPEQGAKTTLHCALDASAGTETGLYYDKSRVAEPSALAQDDALAKKLWEQSEAWVNDVATSRV